MFVLAFAWISGQLFFEDQTNNLMTSVFSRQTDVVHGLQDLRVVYSEEPSFLEPTFYDPSSRQRLVNIFEPLVRLDRDLNIRPSLALSWGKIDEVTWEFRLRPAVKFHNGQTFSSTDVKASFGRAMHRKDSQLIGILDSIKSVDVLDDLSLRIVTKKPDPLFLQRISTVLILPVSQEQKERIDVIGTGPYKFSSWVNGDKLKLDRFEEYWGSRPKFAHVEMRVLTDKSERVGALTSGQADLLDFVPFDGAKYVIDQGYKLVTMPSLEVQFLFFNFKSPVFNDVKARRIFSLAIDTEDLVKTLGKDYSKTVSQFVSNGIFGFNPEISSHEFDLEKAEMLAQTSAFKGQTISFHMPKSLDLLGEHVRTRLSKIGINVIVSYMDDEAFAKSLSDADADVYFLGFKAELGDSSDFLNTLIYSRGSYNVAHYKNEKVDKLIEDSNLETDQSKRLQELRSAMRIAVIDDVFGVPLFEYEKLFAFNDKIELSPRIDGLIYFDEIKIK